MSTFNQAFRQSGSLRSDLDGFQDAITAGTASSARQGQITASLSAFSRTLDTFAKQVANELVVEKKTRDEERLANFRKELSEYQTLFTNQRQIAESSLEQSDRAELFGNSKSSNRKSVSTDNPYSDANVASSAREATGTGKTYRVNHPNFPQSQSGTTQNPYSSYSAYGLGSGQIEREDQALKENNFFGSANQTLDEYIERGRAVLGDLGDQKEMLKGTQRKLYSVANTLGISGDTIRMVERRAKQDKWIFWGGVIVFVIFVYLVLKWLR